MYHSLSGGPYVSTEVMLWRRSGVDEVRCPIGPAHALAVRANAPILVDDALSDKAGVRLSSIASESRR